MQNKIPAENPNKIGLTKREIEQRKRTSREYHQMMSGSRRNGILFDSLVIFIGIITIPVVAVLTVIGIIFSLLSGNLHELFK